MVAALAGTALSSTALAEGEEQLDGVVGNSAPHIWQLPEVAKLTVPQAGQVRIRLCKSFQPIQPTPPRITGSANTTKISPPATSRSTRPAAVGSNNKANSAIQTRGIGERKGRTAQIKIQCRRSLGREIGRSRSDLRCAADTRGQSQHSSIGRNREPLPPSRPTR